MDLNYSTLELTTHIGCPADCSYCPQRKTVKNYVGERMMSVEMLSKCLDKIPIKINSKGNQSPRIEFSGFCEPYANPNCSDLINTVYDKGFNNITLYTTFMGFTMSDYEKIKHIPFQFVSIHLPDTAGMAKIRTDGDYFKLFSLFLDTFDVGFFSYGEVKPEVMDLIYQKKAEGYPWLRDSIHSRAGNVDGIPPRDRVKGHMWCTAINYMEMDHNVLLPNGDVSLCCMDFSLKHIVGNLLTGAYEDIFKSDEHNKIVAGMFVEEMDILCRHCDYIFKNPRM